MAVAASSILEGLLILLVIVVASGTFANVAPPSVGPQMLTIFENMWIAAAQQKQEKIDDVNSSSDDMSFLFF